MPSGYFDLNAEEVLEHWEARDAVREFIAGVLRLEGAMVAAASTGAEALALVNGAAPYHLVVLDLCLPDITGWDVLDGIRRAYPSAADCTVVLLTASVDDESRHRAASAGVGFLTKPIGARALVVGLAPFLRQGP